MVLCGVVSVSGQWLVVSGQNVKPVMRAIAKGLSLLTS